jgi:hypothetical protein
VASTSITMAPASSRGRAECETRAGASMRAADRCPAPPGQHRRRAPTYARGTKRVKPDRAPARDAQTLLSCRPTSAP